MFTGLEKTTCMPYHRTAGFVCLLVICFFVFVFVFVFILFLFFFFCSMSMLFVTRP